MITTSDGDPADGTELFADTFIAWVYDAWNPLNIDEVDKARSAMDDW